MRWRALSRKRLQNWTKTEPVLQNFSVGIIVSKTAANLYFLMFFTKILVFGGLIFDNISAQLLEEKSRILCLNGSGVT